MGVAIWPYRPLLNRKKKTRKHYDHFNFTLDTLKDTI